MDVRFLRIGIAGVRGFIGQTLTPELAIDFASAFGACAGLGATLLTGRDPRSSSPMLNHAVASGLLACGCNVVDAGICPTPMLQWAVRARRAAGGIMITAAHSGAGWNGLTFLNRDGAMLTPQQGETLLDIYHARQFALQPWDKLGARSEARDVAAGYFDALERYLDADCIRRAHFTVVVDPCGGAGAPFLEEFGRRLGLRLIAINGEPDGCFAHDPEPRPRNARQAAAIIRPVGGHAGFVFNTDMTRMSVVSELPETVTEEYTFPLVAAQVLSKRAGPVVTNCCSTRTLDDLAARHGVPVIKTPVGQPFVMHALIEEGGLLAGDGAGSAGVADWLPGYDSFLAMGLVLEAMARRGKRLSELVAELPRYHIVKPKIYCPSANAYRAVAAVRARFANEARVSLTDGFRVDWDDAWMHVRAAASEPLVRVICEARTREKARRLADELTHLIEREAA
jgi:phosphomannomutase